MQSRPHWSGVLILVATGFLGLGCVDEVADTAQGHLVTSQHAARGGQGLRAVQFTLRPSDLDPSTTTTLLTLGPGEVLEGAQIRRAGAFGDTAPATVRTVGAAGPDAGIELPARETLVTGLRNAPGFPVTGGSATRVVVDFAPTGDITETLYFSATAAQVEAGEVYHRVSSVNTGFYPVAQLPVGTRIVRSKITATEVFQPTRLVNFEVRGSDLENNVLRDHVTGDSSERFFDTTLTSLAPLSWMQGNVSLQFDNGKYTTFTSGRYDLEIDTLSIAPLEDDPHAYLQIILHVRNAAP